MTRDRPSRQPRTNKRKGKSDISLVLIKRVNLALWLGQEAGWPRLPTGGGGWTSSQSDSVSQDRQAGVGLQEGEGAHLPWCLPSLPG